MSKARQRSNAFEQAGEEAQQSLLKEFIFFMNENKKWWLSPILILIVFLGMLIMVGGTGLAPFVYTLF